VSFMTEPTGYYIVTQPDGNYAVCVWEPDALPRYVPGFHSEAGARRWIEEQEMRPDMGSLDHEKRANGGKTHSPR
jgi:hypothetical protein